MSGNELDNPEVAKSDPAFTELPINVLTPVVKRRFRAEVPLAHCGMFFTPFAESVRPSRLSQDVFHLSYL